MLVEFQEIDVNNGETLSGIEVGKDTTVYVKKGGVFEGTVGHHGSVIVIGGEANIVIEENGSAIIHEGKVRAVVREYGKLIVNDGYATIKEEGGFVDTLGSHAYITYEPSIIKDKVFKHFTTIHKGTIAINCKCASSSFVNIYEGGIFKGDAKHFAQIGGQVAINGIVHHAITLDKSSICIHKGSIVHHLVINGGTIKTDEGCLLKDVYVKTGKLIMRDRSEGDNLILAIYGKIIAGYSCKLKIKDLGGYLDVKSKSQVKFIKKKRKIKKD